LAQITLAEEDARRLFRHCVLVSILPVLGLALLLALATYEASLPAQAIKAVAITGLALTFGGEIFFCHCLGRLAQGLGQSGRRWSIGVWIASKFLFFIAYWLALVKIWFVLARAYAAPPDPLFPR
jgi:hypothetical protein